MRARAPAILLSTIRDGLHRGPPKGLIKIQEYKNALSTFFHALVGQPYQMRARDPAILLLGTGAAEGSDQKKSKIWTSRFFHALVGQPYQMRARAPAILLLGMGYTGGRRRVLSKYKNTKMR